MAVSREPRQLSDRPSPEQVRFARYLQIVALVLVILISGGALGGWMFPALVQGLPEDWFLMKGGTAVGLLLCSLGVLPGMFRSRSAVRTFVGLVAGGVTVVLSVSALHSYATGMPAAVDASMQADTWFQPAGRMALSTAFYLLTAGLAVVTWRDGQSTRATVADFFVTLLLLQTLVIAFAHLYGGWHLLLSEGEAFTSAQTVICMTLLTFAVLVRHLKSGVYALVVGVGIGSSFLRIALPLMFSVPFLGILVLLAAVDQGLLELRPAAAVAAGVASLVTLVLSFMVAGKLNGLEAELRMLSLTDPLTNIYNRRGFEVLAEHRFHEAARHRNQVALLYFDIDGLKHVNDQQGHDVGSQLIQDFANLLSGNFRQTDVIGRLGGDEFAVLMQDSTDAAGCLDRLRQATEHLNAWSGQTYQVRYSTGVEYADPGKGETLTDLINRADQSMYHQKQRNKRIAREAADAALA